MWKVTQLCLFQTRPSCSSLGWVKSYATTTRKASTIKTGKPSEFKKAATKTQPNKESPTKTERSKQVEGKYIKEDKKSKDKKASPRKVKTTSKQEQDETIHASMVADNEVIDASSDNSEQFNKRLQAMIHEYKRKKTPLLTKAEMGVMVKDMSISEMQKMFSATKEELAALNLEEKVTPGVLEEIMELEEEGDELQDSGRALKPASASRPGVPSIPEKWPKKSVYLDDVLVLLREERVRDVVVINMTEKCNWTRYFIIGTGRSDRHNRSIADRIVRRFRTKIADAGLNAAVEGRDSTDWMLVDMGPMVVHLFTQDSRLETNLEAQWLLRFSNPELMDEEDREMYLAQQEP